MTEDAQDTPWPLLRFYFSVDIADVVENISFQEVSGLDVESDVIEYRAGNSKIFSTVKMSGMHETGTVTLTKGVFADNSAFWDWANQIKLNTIARRTVTIKLLDEAGSATMVWALTNAYPVKISGMDRQAEGTEIAVESIDFVHEGINIENGS